MCVKGHYLAEKCSFDQDGVEHMQKGVCGLKWVNVLKAIALEAGDWVIILNAILHKCIACP